MSKVIGIDCDLVLAASDLAWWSWLNRMCGLNLKIEDFNKPLDYNLASYFKPQLEARRIDPMDFWRSTDTYAWVDPVEGSVEALRQFKDVGKEIVIISHVKGHSLKSKWRFLQQHYPGCIDSYLATKEKYRVAVDVMIDDRDSHLNSMPIEVNRIKLWTPYTQDQQTSDFTHVAKNWSEIVELLC